MRMLTRIATFLCLAGLPIGAQNVDPKELLSPPADTWLTYHGEYNGQRHSKLTQITPENVARLKQDRAACEPLPLAQSAQTLHLLRGEAREHLIAALQIRVCHGSPGSDA